MTFVEQISLGLGFVSLVAQEWWDEMPKPLRYVITITGFAFLIYGLLHFIEQQTGMELQKGPLTVIVIGLLVVAGGMIWHIDLSQTGSGGAPQHAMKAEGATPVANPPPPVAQAQFGEMKELEEFLSGKDEWGLRETFDLRHMLTRNIEILNDRIKLTSRWALGGLQLWTIPRGP